MKGRVWLIGMLLLLLLAFAAPEAHAQATTGDRLVMGRSFVLATGDELNGNLVVVGGSATLAQSSVINGDITVIGGSVLSAGTVQGNIAAFGGLVTLENGAIVDGNVATFGGSVDRRPGAVVTGDVFDGFSAAWPSMSPITPEVGPAPQGSWPPVSPSPWSQGSGVLAFVRSVVGWELVTLGWSLLLALLGIVAIAVAPRVVGRVATTAATDTLVSFGMGLLTLAVGLALGLFLLIACCLGLLVWLALAVAWFVGWLAVGLWVGQRLFYLLKVRGVSALAEVALGVFLITLLARIPACIGFFFGLIVGCIGLGAVVLTRFGTRSPELYTQEHGDQPTG